MHHTKNIFFLLIFFLSISQTNFAQSTYDNDDKDFRFGFSLGINAMDFGITPSLANINGKTYQADVSVLKPGFSVGIVSDYCLSRYFNLRCTPTLHFGEREITYTNQADLSEKSSTLISSIPLTIPLLLKYSSERHNNIRPYLIGGAGLYIDMGTNKEEPVLLKQVDLYGEVGIGCDFYLSFFKLSPELKLSLGSQDLFIPLNEREIGTLSESQKIFSNALARLTSRMLSINLNFE